MPVQVRPRAPILGVKSSGFTPKILHWEVLGSEISHFLAIFGNFEAVFRGKTAFLLQINIFVHTRSQF